MNLALSEAAAQRHTGCPSTPAPLDRGMHACQLHHGGQLLRARTRLQQPPCSISRGQPGARRRHQRTARMAATPTAPAAAAAEAVQAEEHWATLLTTMPGLNTTSWCGRLGEFVMHRGPSSTPESVTGTGSILHLWRGNPAADDVGAATQPPSAAAPGSVAISYFTAANVAVTGPGVTRAESADGAGLSPDASAFVWDQAALGATPTSFTFAPDSPQLALTLPADEQQQQAQAPPLFRVLRLLPLSSSGLAVVNAALPPGFGPELASQQPPGSYWFFEVLLTHPDDWSNWQASTLGIAYGWQDGKLSSHRYSWQKATEPQQQPPDGLARVAVSPVMPPARDRSASLASLLLKLAARPGLQHSSTTYSYSNASPQQLLRADASSSGNACHVELQQLLDAVSSSGSSEQQQQQGSEGAVTLWYPQGAMYARVPAQLPGADCGSDGEVAFELGAIHGDGAGLSRCRLVYSTAGSRCVRRVVNDVWTVAG